MTADRTTKILLAAIALFLGVIALRPWLTPAPAQAGGGFSSWVLPLGIAGSAAYLLDNNTGDIWMYTSDGRVYFKGTLRQLGEPLAQ